MLFSELVEGQVLEVVMKYEDDPNLFDNYSLNQSDIYDLGDQLILGEDCVKDEDDDSDHSIFSNETGYHYPPQLFGILDK